MRISDWSSDVCSSDLPFKGRRYKSPPLQGEGEQTSRVVIGRGRVRTIVLVELARQLQRRGVAVAGGQRLEVDRPQRCFLHDLQQALLGQFQARQERDQHAEPAFARPEQRLEAGEEARKSVVYGKER